LSIQRAVSQTAGSVPISTRTAIHVTACRTEPGAAGEPPHPDDPADAAAVMDRLAAEIAPDTMLVSQAAAPFVTGQLGGLQGGVAGVEQQPPPGSGLVLRTSPVPYRPSIAVLPFRDLGGDPQQEYFGDGITEDIIAALSRTHWLFVISR